MAAKVFVNRLKFVPAEKDIKQKALAEKVKRTPTTISRICKNQSQPTPGLFREIALVLNVDIKDLLNSTKVK